MAASDYDLPKLKGVVSMTKVKNALKSAAPKIEPHLHNIRVNGQLRGCSGFLHDPDTGSIVYIDTETGYRPEALFRKATSLKDYSGGTNHFCPPDEIVEYALNLLKKA